MNERFENYGQTNIVGEEFTSTPSKQSKPRRSSRRTITNNNNTHPFFIMITSTSQDKSQFDFKNVTILTFMVASILFSFSVLSYSNIFLLDTTSSYQKSTYAKQQQQQQQQTYRLRNLQLREVASNQHLPTIHPIKNHHTLNVQNESEIGNNNLVVHSPSYTKENNSKLDFIMGGFPKTGSTSILHLFRDNNETNVLSREFCSCSSNDKANHLLTILDDLEIKSDNMKRGIKCPTALWNTKGLNQLQHINHEIKIIIGVRHPIHWFQSFYNYRVTEMHDKDKVVVPPPPQILKAPRSWKGVSTLGSRFEIALMLLGKVNLDSDDLKLLRTFKRVKNVLAPNSFKIFLYDIDQLSDANEERSRVFRKELQDFLNLKQPIGTIPRSNINHFTHENKHPETIDICEAKYNGLRVELMKNGQLSNEWIKSKFVHSEDVVVGGKEHFLELIDRWSKDPCVLNVVKEEKR